MIELVIGVLVIWLILALLVVGFFHGASKLNPSEAPPRPPSESSSEGGPPAA
jgi:hypothetical protein